METKNIQAQPAGCVEMVTAISAITATNTPVAIPCAGAKRIGIEFTEGGTVNNRSGVLTITVSMDGGTNFRAYNMLIDNVDNANTETTPTHVANKTRASEGTDILWLDPATLGVITHIKALVTITDAGSPTGNFTVKATIAY